MVKKLATFLLVILFFLVIGCGSSKDEQEIKDVVQKFWISFPQRNLDSLIESVMREVKNSLMKRLLIRLCARVGVKLR